MTELEFIIKLVMIASAVLFLLNFATITLLGIIRVLINLFRNN